ncbi:MAG: hypothetical protein HOB12_16620 [Gemmatimonadales bacterium]|nr:hypothetical protein [Gemmatimonadales bacterium]
MRLQKILLLLGGLVWVELLSVAGAAGQSLDIRPLVGLDSHAAAELRLAQLRDETDTRLWLLRTPSNILLTAPGPEDLSIEALIPDLRTVWNSDLPSSFNDGALWAGRGLNTRLRAGLIVRLKRVSLVVAPELLTHQNQDFQTIPFGTERDPTRSRWAHPYHPLPESIDQPLRFGNAPFNRVVPGQSSLTVDLGSLAVGVATENAWWGPGIKNGIVLSNQAAGIPRVFLETRRPIVTGAGHFEGSWFLGRLNESDYFDNNPANDHRSLSALAVTFRPNFDPGLTLGLARAVFAPVGDGTDILSAGLNFLHSVGRPNSTEEPGASAPDQVTSFFGRWVVHGFEAYWEWARLEQPESLGDFLEFPQHSQGYTYGLMWAERETQGAWLSVEAELTNLEPSSTWRHRYVYSSYSSRVVPQGYTHEGQTVGASIGTGSSSQWIAIDRHDDQWQAGVFAGRIRWDAAARFSKVVPSPKREDVSLYWGLRGGIDQKGWHLGIELSQEMRLNYLFQGFKHDPVTFRAEGVDIANTGLILTLARNVGP